MPRVGSPCRPARDRRRRLPETSAIRLHAARVPILRARVAPRPDAAAKRTGGEPTHRASLPKPARVVPDRIQTRLANPGRSPDPRVERCAGRATRRSRGATRGEDLAHGRAERARVEVPRSRVPKAARSCFLVSGMSRHESSRAPEKGSSKTEGSSQRNRTRGRQWRRKMTRTPVAVHVVRLASRLPSTDDARGDRDATRAKPRAPPFSAHPVFGASRATRVDRSARPATASRDHADDTQARIRRRRVFEAVRARLQRERRASPRASRASPRGSFKLTLVKGAFRSRSSPRNSTGETKARARARRSETRAGTRSRRDVPCPSPRESRRVGLATLARLAPPTWRARRTRPPRERDANANANANANENENVNERKKTFAPRFRLDASAPPTFSKHISRLRAVRVSVPRPLPRGDEMWLARRMKEVGDWKEDRRGGRPDEKRNENENKKTRLSASLGGVVGRAAPHARKTFCGAENRDVGEPVFSPDESNDEPLPLERKTFSPHRPVRHLETDSSLSSVTFTVTPSPFDPLRKGRNRRRGGWRAAKKKDAEDADEDAFVRQTSTRVDDVFAADAAAWDVADQESDGDGERAERAMLHSLRAARARR